MHVTDKKTGAKPEEKNEVSFKKYVATKTVKVTCNKVFELVEGQEISKEINEAFIKSLLSSNLIKLEK